MKSLLLRLDVHVCFWDVVTFGMFCNVWYFRYIYIFVKAIPLVNSIIKIDETRCVGFDRSSIK